ncbi:MAG: histidine kinase [Bacteroidia bacterium]|nr:histidine kinase [Bacteroidia bacterium]
MKHKFILFVGVFFAGIFLANAQKPIVYTGQKQQIIDQCEFVIDPLHTENLQSVRQLFTNGKSVKASLNLDYTDDVIWIRFNLQNNSGDSALMVSIENALIDSVELYVVYNNSINKQHIYLSEPVLNRKFNSPYFIFPIYAGLNQTTEIYIKVRNTELMLLPVSISSEKITYEENDKRDQIYGIFIGIILVMIFYNLFVFFSTRDSSYFYYVLYILFIGLSQITLSGHTLSMLFGNNPALFKYFIVLFPALSGVFAVIFIRSFLQTKQAEPNLDKGLLVILIIYAISGLTRLWGLYHISARIMDLVGIPGGIIVYIVAIKIYRNGLRSAIYFLIAWTIFIVGIILFILRNFNILPFNNFTNYTLPFGAAIEVALLSFALADKINTLQRQKQEKEKEILAAALENERLIREQNIILEKKVTERTFDLASSNQQLSTALTDLKETQSQLIEKEKMASLGQLTAGIAHEINNPINFVTANINPLKRDLKMMLDLYQKVEALCLTTKDISEKQQLINKMKQEIDYDYLQEEVSFLLKGIDDGAHRTAEIVKGLRIFAHAEENSIKNVDFADGINSALIILNNLLGRIVVKQEINGVRKIDCYPGKLNQIFLNLLSNAIYAVHARFGDNTGGEINISSFSDNDYIYIRFSDNGIGMNEAVQKKLFEPFFTTKPVGEGTGLGMSIVFKTVELHKGIISVLSTVGKGSTLEIKLLRIH